MGEFNACCKEVTPFQSLNDGWKEINLNTGGTQSTLQDIKVVERSSGYSYKDSTKHYTRNRFIYWHISNDILDITEQSLDLNLTGNKLRYKFVDTPILDGVTVHEFDESVVILVPTVCSVHRLVFQHPIRLHRQDDYLGSHPDLSVPSIFADASAAHARDPRSFYIFNNPSTANAQLPHCAASHFIEESEEALFLFAYPSNEIILVRQNAMGENDTVELKHESIMPRFLSGIADKFLNKNTDGNMVISMLMHTFGNETYAITLTRDANLRIWNCQKNQCISINNLAADLSNKQMGTQNHAMRKSVDNYDDNFLLAIYLSFTSESQFCIFKPNIYNGQFRLDKINALHSPGIDLIDFSLSFSSIWTIWRGIDGESSVFTACTYSNNFCYWHPVSLEVISENAVGFLTPEDDVFQAYLDHIFYPGRFPISIISKALSIYKRSQALGDINLSPNILKERISQAVKTEIQSRLTDCEFSEEDHFECVRYCWNNFYSCCVQYYNAATKPLGILHLYNANSSILLKKSMYSILRPVDIIENLIACIEYPNFAQYITNNSLDNEELSDLIQLVTVLDLLDRQINEPFKIAFEREMAQSKGPEFILNELLVENDLSDEFILMIIDKLKSMDLYKALHKLLELLRMDNIDKKGYTGAVDLNKMSLNHLFSSISGVSFVAKTMKQLVEVRFGLCRSLLMLHHLLSDDQCIENDFLDAIRSVCLPETVVLTQAYYVLVWFNGLPTVFSNVEKNMSQTFAQLSLSPVFNLNTSPRSNSSLLDLFIISSAGYVAHKNLVKTGKDESLYVKWQDSLLEYIDQLMQIVWPVNANPLLAEWLLVSGQHKTLQNYVKLMNTWDEWNKYTRNFLLAVSYLCTEEFDEAYDLFMVAKEGMNCDEFLVNKIMSDNTQDADPLMWYFLKVIYLFEHHGARKHAIDLSNAALNITNENNPLIDTIHSIKFKHHLALKQYTEAYDSLNANSDIERKKANLRDFVKTLLESKQLDLLMSYPYAGLEQLFISILNTRARATDSINNVYYDFLYAYHVKRGFLFMREAAGVMYEQAFRLTQYNNMESLEKQMKCYLAALNALNICDERFAWVLKPSDPDLDEEEIVFPVPAGSQEECQKIYIKQQIDIVNLQDLKKEMQFTSARLTLAKFDEKTLTARVTTPNELVALLINCGHYKVALQVCTAFEMPYEPVFQSLAHQCVMLTRRDDPNAWHWIVENDLHDLSIVAHKPSSVVWNLLQMYLFEFEQKESTQLHKVIADKFITLKFHLPHWLLASYKLRNAGELLRIYLQKGYLEGAYNLATEHILAALGYGVEHFGFKHGLVHDGPAFCLPVHIIDALIFELELQNQVNPKKPFAKEHEALRDLFIKYLQTSSRISNEVIHSKMSAIRSH